MIQLSEGKLARYAAFVELKRVIVSCERAIKAADLHGLSIDERRDMLKLLIEALANSNAACEMRTAEMLAELTADSGRVLKANVDQ